MAFDFAPRPTGKDLANRLLLTASALFDAAEALTAVIQRLRAKGEELAKNPEGEYFFPGLDGRADVLEFAPSVLGEHRDHYLVCAVKDYEDACRENQNHNPSMEWLKSLGVENLQALRTTRFGWPEKG